MDALEGFLLLAPMLLFSFTAHELGHAWVARHEGDRTAAALGRITWNPVKHIDPWMTVLLPALLWFSSNGTFVFGGAKPVPVDPRNYTRGKLSDILVSLAGVSMNLVVALGLVLGIILVGLLGKAAPGMGESLSIIQVMFGKGIAINLFLAAFNLIPVPPLDGSHVFKYALPAQWSLHYMRLGFVGFMLLVLLMQTDAGARFFTLWTAPATMLEQAAMRLVVPFVIPTEFTT
ncbi:MAG: site-2 protease family protein [Gemmatimonadetes bacterium]|nr:site-2 protease family protein [Gemmatimonadota bacterium]